MASQKGFKVNVNRCISCRACEMACKVEYRLAAGEGRRRQVAEKTVDESGKVRTYFVSLACNHCADPACVKACPQGALTKDTDGTLTGAGTYVKGVVLHDSAKCVGCRRCEWACPYGAPQYNPTTGKVHKCEMCWQRIAAWKTAHPGGDPYSPAAGAETADKRRLPACVDTCLGSGSAGTVNLPALQLTDIDPDVASDGDYVRPGASGRGSGDLASYTLTNPAVKIKSRVYQKRDGTYE
ncbi:MAG: 4Fe-4S dicluster domain-containing protein [Actinobacteria bacterium]|nr:4Fe-4S dicluster domain-containing protein [Actinomycetota bacterium]